MDTVDARFLQSARKGTYRGLSQRDVHGVHGVQPGSLEWLQTILKVSGSGSDGGAWQCPAHPDATPSLAVNRGRDGHPVIVCRSAGCDAREILAALCLGIGHLYRPPDMTPEQWLRFASVQVDYPPLVRRPHRRLDSSFRLVGTHEYGPDFLLERWRNAAGAKEPQWWSRNQRGEMVPGLLGRHLTDLPLYRQRDISICAATGDQLYLVESESSVDALNQAGHYATTWAGGAANPPLPQLIAQLSWPRFRPGQVQVVADHDTAGIRCAHRILGALPDASGWLPPQEGHDIRDTLSADRALGTLLPLPTLGASQ